MAIAVRVRFNDNRPGIAAGPGADGIAAARSGGAHLNVKIVAARARKRTKGSS